MNHLESGSDLLVIWQQMRRKLESPADILRCLCCTSALGLVAQTNTPSSPPSPPMPVPTVNQATVVPPEEDKALALDATVKEYVTKPGEESAVFTFAVKNVSQKEVVINQVRTSCGCTIAKLPSQPWKLAPGVGGDIQLTVDVRGKTGELIKTATIDTLTGFKVMTLKITIPRPVALSPADMARTRNMAMAVADRQAVFKGECAKCHVPPAIIRKGDALYASACAICHDAAHRATMVPDLHALNHPADGNFWRTSIVEGKPGTLMPAFAADQGGPLAKEQVDSLVDYLTTAFPRSRPGSSLPHQPVPASTAPAAAH